MYETVVCTVTNLSKGAIYGAAIQWRIHSREDWVESHFKGTILPGERWEQPAPMSGIRLGPFEDLRAYATFVDSESLGWAKAPRNVLVRIREAIDAGW
jgi:hypothetical protein